MLFTAGVRLRLPRRKDITCIDPREEPTRYYYWPVVGWFYRRRLQMILDLLGGERYARILEVAYGSGVFLPSLAQLGGELHGIDLHNRIDLVEETLEKAGVSAELVSGDARRLPYAAEYFDCVVNVSMLEHMTEPGQFIDEMRRVLRPGGILALGFPCRNAWMDAFFRLLGFDPARIHPSTQFDILAALKQRGLEGHVVKLPQWLPLGWALYCCCAFNTIEQPGVENIRRDE